MNNHRWHLVFAFSLLLAFSASRQVHAGEPDHLLEESHSAGEGEGHTEIETDRDSFTPATTLIPKSKVMIESAWGYIDNREGNDTHSLPELLIRYGAFEKLELRLAANYETGLSGVSGNSHHGTEGGGQGGGHEEEAFVLYGLKLDVTDQKGWIPDSAILVRGASTITEDSTTTRFIGSYVLGWTLRNGWGLASAIRYSSKESGGGTSEEWAPSAVVKIPLMENTKAHVEYFGIYTTGSEANDSHYISPGVHYLITENFEVGVRVGWGLNDQSSKFFTNVGFGWQF